MSKSLSTEFSFLPKTGRAASFASADGVFPFFTSSQDTVKRTAQADCYGPALVFGTGGSASIHFVDGPFSASNDCYVCKPNSGTMEDAKFAYYFLKSNIHLIEEGFKGAGLRHVSKKHLLELEIPADEAIDIHRVVAILDMANAIRRKREQANALADNFLRSAFLEIFGDPSSNPNGHPVKHFETILLMPLRNGISPSSKGNISANVLTLSAITGDRFDADQSKEGKFVEPISAKDTVNRSDFYICRGNGSADLIGKGYFADRDIGGTAFPDTMIAAKPDPSKVTRAYLEKLWNSSFIRNQIRAAARTTNGTFKINQTAAGAIQIPVPALSDQIRYEAIVDHVGQAMSKLAYGDDLFPALSQRAFRGEL